ncbi:MAG: response regulator [Butyricimonas faecihominis]
MAEDNDSNYALLLHMLKDYDLMRAENGVEAVDAVRNGNFDFVLMDLKMPIMGGLKLPENSEFDTEIPIIALTANAFDSDR